MHTKSMYTTWFFNNYFRNIDRDCHLMFSIWAKRGYPLQFLRRTHFNYLCYFRDYITLMYLLKHFHILHTSKSRPLLMGCNHPINFRMRKPEEFQDQAEQDGAKLFC